MKFQRRSDLTPEIRIQITLEAILSAGRYGARSHLACQYQISRTLLYHWIASTMLVLQELFSTVDIVPTDNRLTENEVILLLRLEGRASIQSISDILIGLGYEKNNSVGTVSQRLTAIGRAVTNALQPKQQLMTFWLSDEIFANGHPILITIDPVSTAILRIDLADNRQALTWENHFRLIEANQIGSLGICSDRAKGITEGYSAFNRDLNWCSDHFHEFRQLVNLLFRAERQAYAAIEAEYKREQVFLNRRSEKAMEKQSLKLELAHQDCEAKINRYEQLNDCLSLLFPSLYFFDLSNGAPRFSYTVKEELSVLFDLLDEIEWPALNQEVAKVRGHIDEICMCYQWLEEIWPKWTKRVPETTLCYLSLAWQHAHQSHQHKGKGAAFHRAESQFWLEAAENLLPENEAPALIEELFEQFDGLVRSSSLVEMVNSSLRLTLNSCRGNISQEQLNLFMFYFNHHQFHDGKRKGRSPIGILTGTEPEEPWYKLLAKAADTSVSS